VLPRVYFASSGNDAMKSQSLLDRLTGTRVASWSDRGFHRRQLADHGFAAKKVYLLGYATASPDTMQRIARCVHLQSAGCLRGVFQDLPYSDEFWPEPLGPMSAVYLLLAPGQVPQVVVLDAAPGSPVLLHMPAKGFPHHFLFGKTLVSEAT
jgi:hypothetical protein